VPFKGDSPGEIAEKKLEGDFIPAHAINPEVPPLLDGILARMMARNPRDRFQTASELIVQLERSQLSAALPSFVELDQALTDPLVRSRLTAPAEATRPDLQNLARKQAPAEVKKAPVVPKKSPGSAAILAADSAGKMPALPGIDSSAKVDPTESKTSKSRRLARWTAASSSSPLFPISFWVLAASLLLATAGFALFLAWKL